MSLLDRLKDLISSEEQPAPEAPPEPEPEPVAEPEVKEPEPAPPAPEPPAAEAPPPPQGSRMVAQAVTATPPQAFSAAEAVVSMNADTFFSDDGQTVFRQALLETFRR